MIISALWLASDEALSVHVGEGVGRYRTVADPGGVQGVRTPALLIRVPFLKRNICSKHVDFCNLNARVNFLS